jgi:hypothetical protein
MKVVGVDKPHENTSVGDDNILNYKILNLFMKGKTSFTPTKTITNVHRKLEYL